MIKSTKKNSQKEKLSNVQTSNLKKITKQKSKIPLEKKNSSSKPKLNTIKVTKNITESKFCPKRNHNSISSKEDVNIKFASKSNRNKFKPNNIVYNNTNKIKDTEEKIELMMQTEGYAIRQMPQYKIDLKILDI